MTNRVPGEVRAVLAVGALTMTAVPLRRNTVGRQEMRAFRLVNDLPDSLFGPAWTVMQLGTLGAAPATAGVAYLAGRPHLAFRLAVRGAMAWAIAKAVKQIVRRGRPHAILEAVRCRGREPSGHGYLSGHAAVAAALAITAAPELPPVARSTALTAALLVGLSRIYVGAHLPLDVAGGAALGLLVDSVLGLDDGDRR